MLFAVASDCVVQHTAVSTDAGELFVFAFAVVCSTRQQYYEQAAQYLLQEGGKHWACRHHTIVCELLWLWLYSSQQSVQFLQTTLAAQVSECLQCAVALNTARVAVLDCAIAPAPAHTPSGTALRDAIRRWDAVRLSSIFEKFGGEPEPRNGPDDYNRRLQGTLCSHVQVLLQPKLLLLDDDDGKRLNASFSASLAALAQGDLRISGTQPLPGLYLLCVHSNSGIRSWARTQVLSMATLEHPALFLELHEVFDVLVHHCERLTMIRNGCDEDEQEGTLPLPLALSDDEREVWTGFTMVIRHLAPWIVRDQLLTRYGGLLPLALMSVVENSAAVLPAAQCVHYMMRCLGRSFWQVSICSFSPATMRRVLANLATNPSAIVPVRQTCLELLEEVLVTASSMGSEGGLGSGVKGTSTLTLTLSDDIASFLSSRELRSSPAAHVAVSAMATRVLTRVLQRLLDRGGLSELPIISSTEWAPHVAGTACSPNLPLLSKSPPAILLARILALQATSLESALLRRSTSLKPTEHCGANVAAEGRKEQDGKVALPNSVMWLESVWGWLLQNAGTDNIPEQMHVALLQAARTLLIWPCDVADAGADSYSVSILRRFTTLITGYLQSIAGMSVLVATLAQKPQVEQALVELALVQKAEFKEILRELIYRALGMGNQLSNIHGIVPALQVIACRSPTAIAAGMRYAFGHAKQMGLEGDAFGSLHHLFLIAGQMVPLVLPPLLPETRHELLQAAWDMTRAFIQCRARLRTDCVMKRHGAAALDATSSSFFTCFRVLWPHFATLVADAAAAEAHSDDKDFDERPHQSLASAHALWLPAFVKVLFDVVILLCISCAFVQSACAAF